MADQFRQDDIDAVRHEIGEAAASTFERLSEVLQDNPETSVTVERFCAAGCAALVAALDELCEVNGLDTEAVFEQMLDAKRMGFNARSRAH